MLGLCNIAMYCSYPKKSVQWETIDHEAEHTQFHGQKCSFLTSDSMYLPSWLVYCIDAVSNIVSLEDGLLYHFLLRDLA